MSSEQIQFQDTDKYLTATIDDETINLQVKNIIKIPTVINLLNIVDTAFNNNINIKASLHTDDNTPIQKGNVTISILNKDMNIIMQYAKSFTNGNIIDSIDNNLPIGVYYLKIEYTGNQFYLPCEYLTSFNINKRYVGYKIYANNVRGRPNDIIDVKIKLFDFYTHQPISCNVQYTINDMTYLTSTDATGFSTLHIAIPDIDESKCSIYLQELETFNEEIFGYTEEEYYDEEGNIKILKSYTTDFNFYLDTDHKGYIYEDDEEILWFDQAYYYDIAENYENEYNPDFVINNQTDIISPLKYGYSVVIEIIDDVYYREPITQYIYVDKVQTQIGASSIKNDNNHVVIEGNVISDIDVKYGIVSLIINGNILTSCNIDENGYFIIQWDSNNALGNETNHIEENDDYTYALNQRNVGITIQQDENNEYQVGNTLRITANVYTQGDKKPVIEGMVFFTIHDKDKNNKEIYRFPTELNDHGEAVLLFDVSTAGNYFIQAHYCGIFEYLDADSNKENYTIIK